LGVDPLPNLLHELGTALGLDEALKVGRHDIRSFLSLDGGLIDVWRTESLVPPRHVCTTNVVRPHRRYV
ncbi:MAG: hypothetical protein NZL88_00755, partial [Gaiellaceae bacterium]|nr:hypothetical protein [Gaiellaceae bacterium]